MDIKDEALSEKKSKNISINQFKNAKEQKPFHGRYSQRIRNADIDTVKINQWSESVGLKTETEGLMIVA